MDIREIISGCYSEQLCAIREMLGRRRGHLLVCGLDAEIIRTVIKLAGEHAESLGMEVRHVTSLTKSGDVDNKVFILEITGSASLTSQSLIYYYLERTRSSCYLILSSSSCLCLEGLEKRVKSRFSHRIFFFGFLPQKFYVQLYKRITKHEDTQEIEKWYKINPSIELLVKKAMMQTYGIAEYTNAAFYELLSPVHLALLLLSSRKRIGRTVFLQEFRKFTSKTSELRKAEDTEITFYYIDLVEAGMIDKEGSLSVSLLEIKSFISGHSPLFIRKLMSSPT
jgi:origin recognition complex subunit 4